MYLDFDDHRPDVPRVPSAISPREGVMLSFFLHGLMVLAIVFLPGQFLQQTPEAAPVVPVREPTRFVYMAPRVDRPAPPRPTAEMSDLDRRSATRERAPDAANAIPFSRGDSREKVEGARAERPVGPETPTPAPPAPPAPPPSDPAPPSPPLPDDGGIPIPAEPPVATPPSPAGGGLGSALRNLQRYLDDQTFDNQRGGQTEQGPDIQFDSRGADFGPWLRRFRNQVMRNWLIPQAAMTQSGNVVIQFYVLRNGTIVDVQVVRPSRIEAFTIAAFNALKMSNPTSSLPADYPLDRAFFTVTFHYNEG
jgi:TonB family protein